MLATRHCVAGSSRSEGSVPIGHAPLTAEHRGVAELGAKVKRLEQEKAILKLASA